MEVPLSCLSSLRTEVLKLENCNSKNKNYTQLQFERGEPCTICRRVRFYSWIPVTCYYLYVKHSFLSSISNYLILIKYKLKSGQGETVATEALIVSLLHYKNIGSNNKGKIPTRQQSRNSGLSSKTPYPVSLLPQQIKSCLNSNCTSGQICSRQFQNRLISKHPQSNLLPFSFAVLWNSHYWRAKKPLSTLIWKVAGERTVSIKATHNKHEYLSRAHFKNKHAGLQTAP